MGIVFVGLVTAGVIIGVVDDGEPAASPRSGSMTPAAADQGTPFMP